VEARQQTQIQVFVSSTNGLIEVQSISDLPNANLRSVVSINFSAQLASISQDYANFVSKPQGIIQSHFGMREYRLNLSADIDQGNSWQLGAYVAHLLYQYDHLYCASKQNSRNSVESASIHNTQYQMGASDTTANLIVIATGAINTESEDVMSIGHLAKKCETANSQIRQWQSEGKRILFLVPFENYKEPIPDSNISLCPIKHLSQLPGLLTTLFDLPSHLADELNATFHTKNKIFKPNQKTAESEQTEGITIEAQERSSMFNFRYPVTFKLVTFGLLILLACLLYFTLSYESKNDDEVLHGLEYRLSAVLSENKSACRLAVELAQSERSYSPSENQYLAAINGGNARGVSELRHFNQAPTSSLANICQLTLHSSEQIKAIWMVSDQTELLNVLPIIMPSDNRHWSIPLVHQGNNSMHYHLLLFTENPDAADFQSLQSYLVRHQNTENLISADALSNWSRQLALPVVFLSHRLQ
jgi:hypothetical protein